MAGQCPRVGVWKEIVDLRDRDRIIGYRDVTESKDPAAVAARERFDEVLKHFPAIQKADPFWKTKAGVKFLSAYTDPAAVRKHLHNHRDYEYAK